MVFHVYSTNILEPTHSPVPSPEPKQTLDIIRNFYTSLYTITNSSGYKVPVTHDCYTYNTIVLCLLCVTLATILFYGIMNDVVQKAFHSHIEIRGDVKEIQDRMDDLVHRMNKNFEDMYKDLTTVVNLQTRLENELDHIKDAIQRISTIEKYYYETSTKDSMIHGSYTKMIEDIKEGEISFLKKDIYQKQLMPVAMRLRELEKFTMKQWHHLHAIAETHMKRVMHPQNK